MLTDKSNLHLFKVKKIIPLTWLDVQPSVTADDRLIDIRIVDVAFVELSIVLVGALDVRKI